MFLPRLTKSIAMCAAALAALLVVSFPAAISTQGIPGTEGAPLALGRPKGQ
jgi:hypothetical protein